MSSLIPLGSGEDTAGSVVVPFTVQPAGTVLLLATAADAYRTASPVGGWAPVAPGLGTDGEARTDHGLNLWWLVSTGVENSVTYVLNSPARSAWAMAAGLGLNPADLFDGVALLASAIDGGSITSPPAGSTAGDRMAVAAFGASHSGSLFPNPGFSGYTNGYAEAVEGKTTSTPGLIVSIAWVDFVGGAPASTDATIAGPTAQARTSIAAVFKESPDAEGAATFTNSAPVFAVAGNKSTSGNLEIDQVADFVVDGLAEPNPNEASGTVIFTNPVPVFAVTGEGEQTPLPLPALPDFCWPVDTSCVPNWDSYSPTDRARAVALAGQTLRMLTGFRVGGCPIKVRPCRAGCETRTWKTYPVGYPGSTPWQPVNVGGQWLNIGCGCGSSGSCSCSRVCEVRLDGPVGSIQSVKIDGAVLDPSAYRLDPGGLLVRTDADCWPLCQDMHAADTEPGTWSVTYTAGAPVDGLGAWAAGLLAGEYVTLCATGDCANLPTTAKQIIRDGVTLTLGVGAFPEGKTGIRGVDTYIERWNPGGLRAASVVYSPDVKRPRRT